MNTFLKNNWPAAVLLLLSLFTHFFMLNYPAEVVFDEVSFGQFSQSYYSHQYYFDIHPPLGKLMIFGFSKIFGLNGQLNFGAISDKVDSMSILIFRFLPALFGTFLVVLIYYLILKMKLSKRAAFLGACLVLFDNAILTQSKFVLLDVFLLFFGFLSLYFLLCHKDSENSSKKSYYYLILAVIFATLSFSVKWTGLTFYALIFLSVFWGSFKHPNIRHTVFKITILFALPALVYYSIFAVHFSLLYKSGPGDAYMSAAFRRGFPQDKNQTNHFPLLDKFLDLNTEMYFYNSTLSATHPYGSKWYQWPLDRRPIWYWSKFSNNKAADIWLVGNPVVWWSVFAGIIFSIVILPFQSLRRKLPPIFYLLLSGYFLNIFAYIFVSRVAFLYHYFPSLVFGILILAILYDTILSPGFASPGKKHSIIYFIYLFFIISAFLLIMPITYGITVPQYINHYYSNFIKIFS